MVSVGGTRVGGDGGGGGGKLRRAREPTHVGGWLVSVGGTGGVVSSDAHANQRTWVGG